MSIIGTIGTAVGLGNSIYGLGKSIFGGKSARRKEERQQRYSKELMAQQNEYNAQLMKQGYGLQKDMYNHTYDKNTPLAQVNNLKAAGLNPGLIYGLGGQGGSTTGSGGASVGLPSAPDVAGIQNAETNNIGMGLQMGMMEAQKKLIESQARNIDADTEKKKGVDTQLAMGNLSKIIAETENERSKNRLINLQSDILDIDKFEKGASQDDRLLHIKYMTEESLESLKRSVRHNLIGDETKNEVIDEIKQRALGAALQNLSIETGMQLDKAKINEIAQSIEQKWEQLRQGKEGLSIEWSKLDNDTKRTATDMFKAEIQADYPSLMNTIGKGLDKVLEYSWNLGKLIKDSGVAWKPKRE